MIIVNGYIKFATSQGGGFNPDKGFEDDATVVYGEFIECQYNPNESNRVGLIDGEAFTIASYIIWIEECLCTSNFLQLYDLDKKLIGEFKANLFPKEAVCQIKIVI